MGFVSHEGQEFLFLLTVSRRFLRLHTLLCNTSMYRDFLGEGKVSRVMKLNIPLDQMPRVRIPVPCVAGRHNWVCLGKHGAWRMTIVHLCLFALSVVATGVFFQ